MNSKDLYLRLLRYVLPYRKIFALSLLGTIVFAATEPAMPALMKPLLDETFVAKDPEGLILLPLLLIGLFIIRGLASYASGVGVKWVATRVVMDMRAQMFGKLLALPAHYYDTHSSGDIIAKHIFNVERVMQAATTVVVTLVKDSLIVIGLLGWALYVNWQLSLIIFLITPPTALIIRLVSRRLRKLSRSLQNAVGDLTRIVQETTQGSKEIKIFGGTDYEKKRFMGSNNWVRRYNMKVVTVSEANVPVIQLLTVVALSIVVYFAALQSHAGDITVGEFVSLIGALAMLSSPIKRLTRINTELQAGLAAAESVFALIDEESEVDTGTIALDRARGDIEFRNVNYTHHGGESPVLNDINIRINAGETIALVGPSGSGKTTLANLLARFYIPTSGTILLDGTDIQTLKLVDLRQQLAYVGQHVVLFNDSVAANIAYGAAGVASDDTIRAAAEKAHAMEFIKDLADGFDTEVGENGVRLSGGQRQRIAIARALIKDAPILILDEATSALDTASEKQVQLAIESLRKGRTSLVIAHRLSTIENADRIIVMEAGRIVEEGTHQGLLEKSGTYASLYNAQISQPKS
jgi:subfamily B ATP-binding cassette protein MsbA